MSVSYTPTWRATGSLASGTGGISVSMPSGVQPHDLLILFVESENQDIATPSGWTQIDSAQGTGTAAAAASARLEIFYKYAGNAEGSVSVADSGDHTSGFVAAFYGTATSSPIDVATGDTGASSTSVTFPAVTTTVDGCLVVNAIAGSQDTTSAQLSGWTNANLASITERGDAYTTSADGGGISFACGIKTSAGSTGSTTATAANATAQARITFAIKPLVVDKQFPYPATVGAAQPGLYSTSASGTGDVTVSLIYDPPDGSLMILFVETANEAVSTPSGWTLIGYSGRGTAGNTAATRITAFYKWYNGDSGVTITDPGNHCAAQIFVVTGADPVNPIDTYTTSDEAADTSVTYPDITTSRAYCMVINIVALDIYAAIESSFYNANLKPNAPGGSYSVASIVGVADSLGNNGCFYGHATYKETAGATGSATSTCTSAVKAMMAISINPVYNYVMSASPGSFSVTGKPAALYYTNVDGDVVIEDCETEYADAKAMHTWLDESSFDYTTITRSDQHVTNRDYSWEVDTSVVDPDGSSESLDDFESFSGGLPDTVGWIASPDFSAAGITFTGTITQSTSNVQTGTYSCRVQATGLTDTISAGLSMCSYDGVSVYDYTAPLDLTGVSAIEVDVYDDLGNGVVAQLIAFDTVTGAPLGFESTTGAGGLETLSMDISAIPNSDKDSVVLSLLLFAPDSAGYDGDFYFDNLVKVSSGLSPETAVIESFDNFTSDWPTDLTWQQGTFTRFGSSATAVDCTPLGSTYTQGTNAALLSGVYAGTSLWFATASTDSGPNIISGTPINLAGVASVSVDAHYTSGLCAFYMYIRSEEGMTEYEYLGTGSTATVTVDISAWDDSQKQNCWIEFEFFGSAGTFQWLFDNLRTYGLPPPADTITATFTGDASVRDYVSVNIYVDTLPASGEITLLVKNYADVIVGYSSVDNTGSSYLAVDLTGGSDLDKGLKFEITCRHWDDIGETYQIAGVGEHVFYLDGLRLTDDPAISMDYPMVADTGSFTLSGQNSTLRRDLKIPGGQGSFTLNGQNAGVKVERKLAIPTAGSFTLSGQNSNLLKGFTLDAETGEFTLTGIDADYDRTWKLLATTSSFALTGNDAFLAWGRKFKVDAGAFTLSGQNVNLLKGFTQHAEVTPFTLTGKDASLKAIRTMPAETAEFDLTGQDVNLTYRRGIAAYLGQFVLTGVDAGKYITRVLKADTGTFSLTGENSILAVGHKLISDAASFTMNGVNAGLQYGRNLVAETGEFELTGVDAGKYITRKLLADVGDFALTGISNILRAGHKLPAGVGTFNLTGIDSDLQVSRNLPASTGVFTLTGKATGTAQIRTPSTLFSITKYAPTFIGERIVNKVHTPLTTFTIDTDISVASGASVAFPTFDFTMTAGIGYYKIKLIKCTGDPVPEVHVADSKKLEADAYVDLFQIILQNNQGILYLKQSQDLDWQGNTYEGTGIKIEGVGNYADDQVSRPKLSLFNPEGIFSSLVNEGLLENATIVRIRVLKEHIDADLPVYRRQQWRVSRVSSLKRNAIGLELRDMLDGQNFQIPGRMFLPPDFPMVNLQ